MHHGPCFALVMDRDTLDLIVDRLVNAIDTLGMSQDDHNRRVEHLLGKIVNAIEYIHLECEGT